MIMGIETKRRGWDIGEIKINVYKIMTSEGPRKIKSLVLEIFMSLEIDLEKYKILQHIAEECPVKLNLEECVDIELNWYKEYLKLNNID
ncbi:OsmC family protein [Prochlorococcus marinus]|uniref:OsmC family protein n=1 Tax=Prochlorococcus marinus TaxID=1219 RepID=UPI00214C540E|nr:OsmC family protein [Prochlorococcus marinus]